ncbi:MAG: 1,5-anhydro-D-fructose reductase [bacterium ADurb.Bin429]|nr:MAG: 1,5-anhydro-D-fructose reductase [bacterium ADurb.Bin429]
MAEVRLGILGVGGFGRFCLEQYQRMLGVRVTAIAGTRTEKYAALARQYDIPHAFTDWRALVTHPEVDIVHLATPPDLRAAPALAAIAAGKHVWCEKPLAITLAAADAMLTAADRRGVRVGVNFIMRYSPLYDLLRVLVREELFGAPQRLLFENHAADLSPDHWFWDPARSGAIPVEHGVHFFDLFSSILGDGRLRWAGRTCRPNGVEDKWQIVVQYGARVLGSFYHAFDMPAPLESTRAVLDCARGRFRLDGWIPERLELEGLVNPEALARLTALLPEAGITTQELGGGPWRADGEAVAATTLARAQVFTAEKSLAYGQAVRAALADFITWTRQPGYHPRVTGTDGRAALALALRARELARADAAAS